MYCFVLVFWVVEGAHCSVQSEVAAVELSCCGWPCPDHIWLELLLQFAAIGHAAPSGRWWRPTWPGA